MTSSSASLVFSSIETWVRIAVRGRRGAVRPASASSARGGSDAYSREFGCPPNYLGDWIARHRNVTFHYPEIHPAKAEAGKEEIKQALERAISQKVQGKITLTSDYLNGVRPLLVNVSVELDREGAACGLPALRASSSGPATAARPAHRGVQVAIRPST